MTAAAGRVVGAEVSAHDLQIAGLVPLSTLDWPGRLAAVAFLQGCPWDCGYCQNPELRDNEMPGLVAWAEVVQLLSRRAGLLDALVFSGGEATRHDALLPAIRETLAMGFEVGLHTAGAYPRRLAEVLPLIDWVGLDIKSLPADYQAVVGSGAGGAKAWESLDLVMAAGLAHEIRLTIHPGSPQATHALEIAKRVRDRGATHFALQDARAQGTRVTFQALAATWDRETWRGEFNRIAAEISALGFESFEAR